MVHGRVLGGDHYKIFDNPSLEMIGTASNSPYNNQKTPQKLFRIKNFLLRILINAKID
jgi:hypothetical protein